MTTEANIELEYVSFETAKLLKEKGFTWNETVFRNINNEPKLLIIKGCQAGLDNSFPCYNDDGKEIRPKKYTELNKHYPRPTIQTVLKWLRLVHYLHVTTSIGHDECKIWYNSYIEQIRLGYDYEPLNAEVDINGDTPEESTEEAIKYILIHLI
jgi:hypothetical protein